MKLTDYDFNLPQELIAQTPVAQRDHSRLMVVERESQTIHHCQKFSQVVDYFKPGDVLVVNNTRVIPAQLIGRRTTGARVEMLIIEYDGQQALTMIHTRKRPQIGEIYHFEEYRAEVTARSEKGWYIKFIDEEVVTVINNIGYPPLPPYIKRKGEQTKQLKADDKERYQTIYARSPGAIAAPTAGLHFTDELLEQLRQIGVIVVQVTLHVGPGTFLPIRTEEVEDHNMQEEQYEVDEQTAQTINDALQDKRRVIAVGSTSCRTLESVGRNGSLMATKSLTGIYIYPGFSFKVISGLITNFHLPKSTLVLLVSAFANRDLILCAYKEAIAEKYRFYSYGDAMLIL